MPRISDAQARVIGAVKGNCRWEPHGRDWRTFMALQRQDYIICWWDGKSRTTITPAGKQALEEWEAKHAKD